MKKNSKLQTKKRERAARKKESKKKDSELLKKITSFRPGASSEILAP